MQGVGLLDSLQRQLTAQVARNSTTRGFGQKQATSDFRSVSFDPAVLSAMDSEPTNLAPFCYQLACSRKFGSLMLHGVQLCDNVNFDVAGGVAKRGQTSGETTETHLLF